MLPSRLWTELTTADLAQTDMARVIAVLPVAAVEQHGPHLPLGTDCFVMEGYLERVRARLPEDLPAVFLPTQQVGCSTEHTSFPGTLSLEAKEALAQWGTLIADVARTGCRKLVVVNAHGGNSSLVELVARDARARLDLLVATASWSRFGVPEGLVDADELTHGIHGGQVETALMLHFRPDLVRMPAARDRPSTSATLETAFEQMRMFGRPTGLGWKAEDLNPAGSVGRAAAATAALGEALANHGADAFVSLLLDLHRYEPPFLRRRKPRRPLVRRRS